MKESDIKWHPAFAAAIRLELKEYENHLDYSIEHELTQEPLKIDIVVVKKLDDIEINTPIGKILKTYNIFEYKSPTDYISIDDFFKVKAYAYLYKALEGKTNSIDLNEMTITLTCTGKPKKLIKYLEENNIEVIEQLGGIYYIKTDIDVQLIVTKELSEDDLRYLKLLQIEHKSQNLLKSWIQEYSKNNKDPLYILIMELLNKNNPDELLEVYKEMAVPKISEANREFLMDAIKTLEIDKELKEKAKAEGEAIGEARGEAKGEIKGKAELLIKLLVKKFKKVPNEYREKINKLPQEALDVIGMDIFDLESIEDLNQYL